MRITEYIRKLKNELGRAPHIGFLGLGVSNLALIKQALECDCAITLRSDGTLDQDATVGLRQGVRVLDGERSLYDICEDALFLSPSVRREGRPELTAAACGGVRLISDAELFFLDAPGRVYAVSGSDGKSTTATLAHALLCEEYPSAALLGNIGKPFCTAPESASVYVAEMSSFQLRYTAPSTTAAIITSITENHLDWHDSFDEYISVKLSLTERADRAVLPADDEICARYLKDARAYATYSGRLTYRELKELYRAELYVTAEAGYIYTNGERVIPISAIHRREWYNLLNLMGAMCLTSGHYSREHLWRVASEFRGLSHRKEHFLRIGGKEYVDSSIDTTPARTLATLNSITRPVSIILGGRSKHVPLGALVTALKERAVRIALYGAAGGEYYRELCAAGVPDTVQTAVFPAFREATEFADGYCGDVTVLLSPAATGYGEFRNYAERGDTFKKIIKDKYKTDPKGS